MTLVKITKGDALSEMTFTEPKTLTSGCRLPWDAEEVSPEEATNGTMVILTFEISENASAGEYKISLTNSDVVDNDLHPVVMQIIDGKITIE